MNILARGARLAGAVACLLLLAGAARAALVALEQAVEMPLVALRMPVAANTALVVRRCAKCKPELLRVTTETRYFVRPGREAVTLREARKAAAAAAARPAALAYVYYQPETRTVRRLVLDPGP